MTEKVQIGQIYQWAGKRWEVVDIKNGTAKVENLDERTNTWRMPLEQFRTMAPSDSS